jgi:hypothetical protein
MAGEGAEKRQTGQVALAASTFLDKPRGIFNNDGFCRWG